MRASELHIQEFGCQVERKSSQEITLGCAGETQLSSFRFPL